jgi:multidrug efflux pump subunit AcrA (membrane-fusion protein)
MRRLLRRRIVVPAVVVALVLGGGLFMRVRGSDPSTTYRTAAASLGTVTQTMSLSGNLAPVGETDLDFGSSGRVTSVNVQVGQPITAGEVLATIDSISLQGALTQAQATLASAKARLALDQAGPTAASLAQSQASVSSAQVSLQNAQTAATDTRAVNQQSVAQAQSGVTAAQASVNADNSNIAIDCPANAAQCTLDRQALARDQATYQSAVSSLQATQTKAQQSNDQAAGQVSTARVQLQNAQAALSVLEQGSTPEQIQMDQSQVQIDQVNVANAQRAVDQATLTAPAAGVAGQVNITVGQAVSGSGSSGSSANASSSSSSTTTHAVVILTPGAFEVTGTVSDAQINEVAIGQRARVVPAGSTEAITGKVTSISQEATVTSGVATFSVTVTLDGNNPSLHAGVSAAISIIVNQVVHVLTVPTSAVQGGNSVQVLVNGVPQTVAVQVGASDALRTEIQSGLNVGDTVVIATVSSAVPTASARTGAGGLFGVGGGGTGTGRGGGGGAGAGG